MLPYVNNAPCPQMAPQNDAKRRQPESPVSPTLKARSAAVLKDQVWAVRSRFILDEKFVKQAQINESLSCELSGVKKNYTALAHTHAQLKEDLISGQAEIKALMARVAVLEAHAIPTKSPTKETAVQAATIRGQCLWFVLAATVLISK